MVDKPRNEGVQARITIPTKGLPAPVGANWFVFSGANLDVQMLIGYIDPQASGSYARAIQAGTQPTEDLAPQITHRIMLSVSGFAYLRQQVNEMALRMKNAGVLLDDAPPSAKKNG
jgi:hypothetical protein